MQGDGAITEDPAYKASVNKLDNAIREHFALVERWANEHDDDVPGEDASTIAGWVLIMGTVGWNSENGEFHDAVVELPPGMNTFMGVGLAHYGAAFMDDRVNNFGDME